MVDKGQLKINRAVKIVQEIAPVLKDGALILVLCQLVVDVIETDGLGVQLILYPADPVPSHLAVGNGFLRGDPFLLCPPFGCRRLFSGFLSGILTGSFACRLSCRRRCGGGSHIRFRNVASAAFLRKLCFPLCPFPCLLFLPLKHLRILFCLDPGLSCRLLFGCRPAFFFHDHLFSADLLRLFCQLFLLFLFSAGQRTFICIRHIIIRIVIIPVSHGFYLLSALPRRCRPGHFSAPDQRCLPFPS